MIHVGLVFAVMATGNHTDNPVESMDDRALLEEIAGELRELRDLRRDLEPIITAFRGQTSYVGMGRAMRRARNGRQEPAPG